MDNFELTPENAHPKAKALLTEDFYWSPVEETGPFGSDDGSDAFYGFAEWRIENKDESPASYIKMLIDEWGYPEFNMHTTDPEEIKELISEIGTDMIIGEDNAVIAVGFGQFVLEGTIDKDIKELTLKAVERELNADLINEFREDYRGTRKNQLQKMLSVVSKMNG